MELINSNSDLIREIKDIVGQARHNATVAVNHELLQSYWQIGKLIVDSEQASSLNETTARSFILALSKVLSREFGRGFSRSNLFNMRNFYLSYSDVQTVSGHLSWSHYCELLSVSDKDARSFYEKECLNARWSIRELRRQIDSALFQRLLLSNGKSNKEKVLEFAKHGQIIEKPEDIIKDPYVLEFLGVNEPKTLMETDLERKLVERIEDFLLELGRGFSFVGTQKRVTIGNIHHYVDMVFYNKILRAYVLIDLKIGKLKLENSGQMNGYINYYKTEVNEPDDNPPIGIILCADKDEVIAEYALGGLKNQIFASKYTYYIPDKDQLIKQVEAVLEQNDRENDDELPVTE